MQVPQHRVNFLSDYCCVNTDTGVTVVSIRQQLSLSRFHVFVVPCVSSAIVVVVVALAIVLWFTVVIVIMRKVVAFVISLCRILCIVFNFQYIM